jgi:hypothetical protein
VQEGEASESENESEEEEVERVVPPAKNKPTPPLAVSGNKSNRQPPVRTPEEVGEGGREGHGRQGGMEGRIYQRNRYRMIERLSLSLSVYYICGLNDTPFSI